MFSLQYIKVIGAIGNTCCRDFNFLLHENWKDAKNMMMCQTKLYQEQNICARPRSVYTFYSIQYSR
jgi:hypothetical protein